MTSISIMTDSSCISIITISTTTITNIIGAITIMIVVAMNTPGLHNKIPALKILARGWVAQESICLH